MRTCTLVFVALAIVLLYTEYVVVFGSREHSSIHPCHKDRCVTPEKCQVKWIAPCSQGLVCCSVVKPEYRTHCLHHGGQCEDHCNYHFLKHHAGICSSNKTCCVWD